MSCLISSPQHPQCPAAPPPPAWGAHTLLAGAVRCLYRILTIHCPLGPPCAPVPDLNCFLHVTPYSGSLGACHHSGVHVPIINIMAFLALKVNPEVINGLKKKKKMVRS